MAATARLIVDTPLRNPDLIYAIRFSAPDPVIFLEQRGRRLLVLSDLEIDRGRRKATVDECLSLTHYTKQLTEAGRKTGRAEVILAICRERGIRRLQAPSSTSAGLVDQLRRARITVDLVDPPFYRERFFKTSKEVRLMTDAQRMTFRAMHLAETMIRKSQIRGKRLYWQGKVLTSDRLRAELIRFLTEHRFECPDGIIVACGADTTEPHNFGSGPLRPHEAIIVDIFPQSMDSFYFGDATRTFCRGTPSPKLAEMYRVVKAGQALGIGLIRDGVNGRTVHKAITEYFNGKGFETGQVHGRHQGFIHSTGHGIGLICHEEPMRIAQASRPLKAGHVFTVEPGLYYPGIGGVRIEDIVYVTKRGCKVLGSYPKRLLA